MIYGWHYTSTQNQLYHSVQPTYSTTYKTDSASCANVLLLPFIPCTRPIPCMIQVDGVGIASAGDTFFSSSMTSAALVFFLVGTHLHLPVPVAVGPVGGPGHPSCLQLWSQLPGSSALRGFGLPTEPHLGLFPRGIFWNSFKRK